MKMCQEHWEQLRQAIKDRGLWHMVSKSGDGLAEVVERELSGEAPTQATYDPLHNATTMIYSNAIRCGGLYLLTTNEKDEHYCPLCEVEKHTEEKAADWIDPCCDSILAYCRENGWTPTAQ